MGESAEDWAARPENKFGVNFPNSHDVRDVPGAHAVHIRGLDLELDGHHGQESALGHVDGCQFEQLQVVDVEKALVLLNSAVIN